MGLDRWRMDGGGGREGGGQGVMEGLCSKMSPFWEEMLFVEQNKNDGYRWSRESSPTSDSFNGRTYKYFMALFFGGAWVVSPLWVFVELWALTDMIDLLYFVKSKKYLHKKIFILATASLHIFWMRTRTNHIGLWRHTSFIEFISSFYYTWWIWRYLSQM